MAFNMGLFPRRVHRLARIRAAELGLTLKAYIVHLIHGDVAAAAKAARTGGGES